MRLKKIIIFLLFILNCFNANFSFQFTTNINKYYKNIAGNILNLNDKIILNNKLIKNNVDILFKDIEYHNKSICYTFYGKNNLKYILKDNYNYVISFNIYKYRYLMYINVVPLSYVNTTLNIDIRHDKNLKHLNMINKKIINELMLQIYTNVEKDLSVELFKFFNDF